eukprot:TRINITY_DN64646_c0_g1_i1.p1 TRINITY_DN64646_c0_g1~~TRINITY_DN64646_c0_g1_i1.p1  ORF type:complete len:513 (-),score=111.27 TRINITY_DN64646_c0_g1_i1:164-1702(-)
MASVSEVLTEGKCLIVSSSASSAPSDEVDRQYKSARVEAKVKKKKRKKDKKRKKQKTKKVLKKLKKQHHKEKHKKRDVVSSSSSCSSLANADVSAEDGLVGALESGNAILAQHWIRRLGLDWRTAAGDSALHLATRKNRPEVVAWILALPEAAKKIDMTNSRGENALLIAVRFFRGSCALRLVEALADPSLADNSGEAAEALDLDGLLHETERNERCERQARERKALAAVEAARRSREEAEWQSKLFEEMRFDDDEAPFAGFEDLEQKDASSGGRDWMDDIAFEVQERREAERRALIAERLRAVMRAEEEARREADAQEAKAKAAAEADAAQRERIDGSSGASRRRPPPGASPEEIEEARVAARAEDEGRWRSFEARIGALSAAADSASAAVASAAEDAPSPSTKATSSSTSAHTSALRAVDIPWPSGPPENPLHINPAGHHAVVRSQLRAGLLRWHPDKFEQRVARHLPEAQERDKALTRVKAIAQQLNRLMAELAKDPVAAGAGSGKPAG